MAISRVSDLPEISNVWGNSGTIVPEQNENHLDHSLLEISYFVNNNGGKYESKSIRCGALKDYFVSAVDQQSTFNSKIECLSGADLFGHVGINEGVDTLNSFDGLYAYGNNNEIVATGTNLISAASIEVLGTNIVLDSAQNTSMQSQNAINIQATDNCFINSNKVVIMGDIETVFATGVESNMQLRLGQENASFSMPLDILTPSSLEPHDSKLAINIDYLYGNFANGLSTTIVEEVVDRLTPIPDEGGGSGEDTNKHGLDVAATASTDKLFELKTFDFNIISSIQDGSKQALWLLGSSIPKTKIPVMYSILSAANTTGTDVLGEYTINYKRDAYGHKVVFASEMNNINDIRSICLSNFGSFWYYVITDSNVILPANNMYFRSGGNNIEINNLGSQYWPTTPNFELTTPYLGKGPYYLHIIGTSHDGIRATAKTTKQPKLLGNNQYNMQFNETGLVAPPSIQTYTYMVCF